MILTAAFPSVVVLTARICFCSVEASHDQVSTLGAVIPVKFKFGESATPFMETCMTLDKLTASPWLPVSVQVTVPSVVVVPILVGHEGVAAPEVAAPETAVTTSRFPFESTISSPTA